MSPGASGLPWSLQETVPVGRSLGITGLAHPVWASPVESTFCSVNPRFTALRLFSASRLYDGTSTEETLLGKF